MCVQCITEREGDNINMKTIQDHMKIIPKGFFLEKKIILILYIYIESCITCRGTGRKISQCEVVVGVKEQSPAVLPRAGQGINLMYFIFFMLLHYWQKHAK